jgi:hypothetical protein
MISSSPLNAQEDNAQAYSKFASLGCKPGRICANVVILTDHSNLCHCPAPSGASSNHKPPRLLDRAVKLMVKPDDDSLGEPRWVTEVAIFNAAPDYAVARHMQAAERPQSRALLAEPPTLVPNEGLLQPRIRFSFLSECRQQFVVKSGVRQESNPRPST